MGRPYSVDLRERVVAAVEKGAVVPSSGGAIWRLRQHVLLWMPRFRKTGRVKPDQIGGYKPTCL